MGQVKSYKRTTKTGKVITVKSHSRKGSKSSSRRGRDVSAPMAYHDDGSPISSMVSDRRTMPPGLRNHLIKTGRLKK